MPPPRGLGGEGCHVLSWAPCRLGSEAAKPKEVKAYSKSTIFPTRFLAVRP